MHFGSVQSEAQVQTHIDNNDLKFRNHPEIDLRTHQNVQLTCNLIYVSKHNNLPEKYA